MQLEIRPSEQIVPSYSMTGDLLSYLRCKMQYRYYNRSELPPSRPVQYWFGEMVHGTLEMAYRYWRDTRDAGQQPPDFPWPCTKREWQKDSPAPNWVAHDIGKFANAMEQSLKQRGKIARSNDVRDSAYRRVEAAVNDIGKHLFPLITAAESKVIATRDIPDIRDTSQPIRTDKYEIHGTIDVLASMNLSQAPEDNPIRQMIHEACPTLNGEYEVIVDYKGSRRPTTDEPYWEEGNWQVQTYAWLREKQAESNLPVAIGIILYINELLPEGEEIRQLRRSQENGTTDITPPFGSSDEQLVRMWRSGTETSQISLGFRIRRAIRIIPISEESIQQSLREFDNTVLSIETDIAHETSGVQLTSAWQPTCQDEGTCNACDFRWACPSPKDKRTDPSYKPRTPPAISQS